MATTYTALLGLATPTTGELEGTWGTVVNAGITELLETAVAGTTTLSSDADVTLTTTTGAANQARSAIILWTASGTVTRNITAPAQSKAYIVINATGSTQSIVIRGVGPTTGVTVVAGAKTLVAWNGSDFVSLSSASVAASDITGILGVDHGGTGAASFTANTVLLGNGTSAFQTVAPGTSGNVLTSNGTTWASTTPGVGGTVTSISFSGGTTGLGATGSPISTTGTITLNGTLSAANGGTGQTSLTANNVLLGNGTSAVQTVAPGSSGNVLTSNGTTWVSAAPGSGGTVTYVNLSGGTTGLTVSGNPVTSVGTMVLSGTMTVTHGGTGYTTYQTAMNGFAGAVTSGYYLRGNGTNVVMAALAAGDLTGTVSVDHGGTGAASYTANNVLLGNGTSAFQTVAPSTSGNVLVSNGTTWVSGPITSSSVGTVLLLTSTLSGVSSFTISSTYLNSTYDDYVLVFSSVVVSSGTAGCNFAFDTSSGYSYVSLVSTTTTNTNHGASGATAVYPFGTGSLTLGLLGGRIELYGINSATASGTAFFMCNTTSSYMASCGFNYAGSISTMSFATTGVNMTGDVRLYGIKK